MKIGIADGQPRVRYGLRVLLEQQSGWRVVGEAGDAQELLGQVCDACPDLLLLDWELPGMPAAELLARLHQTHPELQVISMSGHDELRQAALAAGANSFASKTESPEKLVILIHELHSNEYN